MQGGIITEPKQDSGQIHSLAAVPNAGVSQHTILPLLHRLREGHSCAAAVQDAFNAMSKPNSATWVFEGGIKKCFDNIFHRWMLDNIPMDKVVLAKWLKEGYAEA